MVLLVRYLLLSPDIPARIPADEMTENGEQDGFVGSPLDTLRVGLADRRSDFLLGQIVQSKLSEGLDEGSVLGLDGQRCRGRFLFSRRRTLSAQRSSPGLNGIESPEAPCVEHDRPAVETEMGPPNLQARGLAHGVVERSASFWALLRRREETFLQELMKATPAEANESSHVADADGDLLRSGSLRHDSPPQRR